MKLCVHCKHHHWTGSNDLCGHPQLQKENPVTGDAMTIYCQVERQGYSGETYPCGKEGLLWESKDGASEDR